MRRTPHTLTKWILALAGSGLLITSCTDKGDEPTPEATANFSLTSNVDQLTTPSFSFEIPTTYDTAGVLAPASWPGQDTRIAQLTEIANLMRTDPAATITDNAIKDRISNVGDASFTDSNLNGKDKSIASKIDENVTGSNNAATYTVRDAFLAMADSVEKASISISTVASNGTAGQLGTSRRIVSANGLEYAQLIEKGLYGACFYDQIVDDYLRDSQSGTGKTNSMGGNATNYSTEGTERQHAWDEAFGYLGANPNTYPAIDNGLHIGKYVKNTAGASGMTVNIAQKLMDAYILGRAALKDGETNLSGDNTDETYFNAARADIKLYVEAGLAGSAFHYLNRALIDINNENRLHYLSEALAFIYALSFNSEGVISSNQAYDVLAEFGWTAKGLEGVYDVNLWEVTATEINDAKSKLENRFTSFGELIF
ncbi:MAG: DUF4856 domain-containing protein [Cyclobacteriaceae bacterium]